MHRLAVSTLLCVTSLAACALERAPILEGAPDVPGLDAPGLDAALDGGMDTPPDFDGGPMDAPPDTPLDTPADAPLDVPPDVPTDARCATGPDRDGDGVRDVCDPCPDDPDDDTDGDGTCDSMDRCPGQDDRLDGDTDGTPDGCDDWPCGERPTVASPVEADGITISSLALAGGGRTAVVAPGATITAAVGYSIQDCGCPGCLDQIEIGIVPGPRAFCAYDGNPPGCPAAATGSRTGNLTAPSAPGTYAVRFRLAQDFSCNHDGRTSWWLDEAPGASRTIGVICVR